MKIAESHRCSMGNSWSARKPSLDLIGSWSHRIKLGPINLYYAHVGNPLQFVLATEIIWSSLPQLYIARCVTNQSCHFSSQMTTFFPLSPTMYLSFNGTNLAMLTTSPFYIYLSHLFSDLTPIIRLRKVLQFVFIPNDSNFHTGTPNIIRQYNGIKQNRRGDLTALAAR